MTTIFDTEHQPPEPGPGDTAHAMVAAAIGSVPMVGPVGAALFTSIFKSPLQRRNDEWAHAIGEAMRELMHRRSLTLDDLAANDAFIDVAAQATLAVMRTSNETKREALRNAVLNAATPSDLDVALQQIFISLVDTFTDWHLRVLAFAENTCAWLEHHADRERAEAALKDRRTFRSLGSVLEQALPDLAGKQEFYSLVWSELHIRQLITTGEPHSSVGEVGTKYTTSLGDQLLAFIRAPSDGD